MLPYGREEDNSVVTFSVDLDHFLCVPLSDAAMLTPEQLLSLGWQIIERRVRKLRKAIAKRNPHSKPRIQLYLRKEDAA